jgi:hypothetical protein
LPLDSTFNIKLLEKLKHKIWLLYSDARLLWVGLVAAPEAAGGGELIIVSPHPVISLEK